MYYPALDKCGVPATPDGANSDKPTCRRGVLQQDSDGAYICALASVPLCFAGSTLKRITDSSGAGGSGNGGFACVTDCVNGIANVDRVAGRVSCLAPARPPADIVNPATAVAAAAGATTPLPNTNSSTSSNIGGIVAGAVIGAIFFILLILLLVRRRRNSARTSAKLAAPDRRDTVDMVTNPLFASHQNPTYGMNPQFNATVDQKAPSYEAVGAATTAADTVDGQANPTYGLGLGMPLQQAVAGREAAVHNPVYEAAIGGAARPAVADNGPDYAMPVDGAPYSGIDSHYAMPQGATIYNGDGARPYSFPSSVNKDITYEVTYDTASDKREIMPSAASELCAGAYDMPLPPLNIDNAASGYANSVSSSFSDAYSVPLSAAGSERNKRRASQASVASYMQPLSLYDSASAPGASESAQYSQPSYDERSAGVDYDNVTTAGLQLSNVHPTTGADADMAAYDLPNAEAGADMAAYDLPNAGAGADMGAYDLPNAEGRQMEDGMYSLAREVSHQAEC